VLFSGRVRKGEGGNDFATAAANHFGGRSRDPFVIGNFISHPAKHVRKCQRIMGELS